MSNMIQAARAQVAQLTQAAYEKAAAAGVLPAGAEVKATIEIPKDTSHGDYASSFAMAGAKALHKAPRMIAQAIVDNLELEGSYFQKVEIAGPGFLNFTLGPKWYGDVLNAVETEGATYGSGDEGEVYSQMVFRQGKRHLSVYRTPYGEMTIGVHARHVMVDLDEDGGDVELDYDIEMDHALTGRNVFAIHVEPSRTGSLKQ